MERGKDPFWFCELGGCEGVSKDCIRTCPYGSESTCPPSTKERKQEYIEQCKKCGKHCTKEQYILTGCSW